MEKTSDQKQHRVDFMKLQKIHPTAARHHYAEINLE